MPLHPDIATSFPYWWWHTMFYATSTDTPVLQRNEYNDSISEAVHLSLIQRFGEDYVSHLRDEHHLKEILCEEEFLDGIDERRTFAILRKNGNNQANNSRRS